MYLKTFIKHTFGGPGIDIYRVLEHKKYPGAPPRRRFPAAQLSEVCWKKCRALPVCHSRRGLGPGIPTAGFAFLFFWCFWGCFFVFRFFWVFFLMVFPGFAFLVIFYFSHS